MTGFLLFTLKYLIVAFVLGVLSIIGLSWFLDKHPINFRKSRKYNEFVSSTAFELLTLAVGLTFLSATAIGLDLVILIGNFVYRAATT